MSVVVITGGTASARPPIVGTGRRETGIVTRLQTAT